MRNRIPYRDRADKNSVRYIEVENGIGEEYCTSQCTFQRRGECWLRDYLGEDTHCVPGRIWMRIDAEGYVLDRDGWRGVLGKPPFIRIDSERYRIDDNGEHILDKKGRPIKY